MYKQEVKLQDNEILIIANRLNGELRLVNSNNDPLEDGKIIKSKGIRVGIFNSTLNEIIQTYEEKLIVIELFKK